MSACKEHECPEGGDHSWNESETGPIDFAGTTARFAVCEKCGESHHLGRGSGVL